MTSCSSRQRLGTFVCCKAVLLVGPCADDGSIRPGDFIYVPPWVPHQEINASEDEKLECVLMRSDSEAVAVNLPDVEPIEAPETVKWIDPTHPE